MKTKKIVLSLSAMIMTSGLFTGCGGGGGSSSNPTTQQAQLIDSNVSGVNYTTASGAMGVTDTNGYFTYLSSDASIEFTIGGLTLANFDLSAMNSDGKVLPTDLAGVDRNDTSNADVLKLLQTFQSLDDDGNASNGINITDAIKNSIVGSSNLKDMSLAELNTTVIATGKTLKTESEAKAHFEDTLRDVISLDIDTIAPNRPTLTSDVNSTYQSAVTIEVNGEVGASIFVNGTDTNLTIGTSGKKEISLSTDASTGSTNTFLITLKDSKSNTSDDYNLTISKIAVSTSSDTTAPIFTSNNTISVDENQNSALTLSATDTNSIAYTISGTDASAFSVNNSTGVVTFNSTPNYEVKNSYSFTAKASDGVNNTTQNVTVSINNIVEPFITVWETNSTKQDITIPINSRYTYDYTVDWGDGTTDTGLDTNATHTYNTDGNHTIKITGTFPTIQFNYPVDKTQINMITAWGDNEWMDFNSSFKGCINLELNATDNPNLSNVTSLEGMFTGQYNQVSKFNTNINDWNVSTITNMSFMFSYAKSFNQPLNNWDVSNVTNMDSMFYQAEIFNQNINDWNTSNVTKINNTMGSGIFVSARSFNQPLNNWDVSKITDFSRTFYGATNFNQPLNDWNVSNATKMSTMFYHATNFNQSLDNWNVSNVYTMANMFESAINFNQSLNNWDVSNVRDMEKMFIGADNFNQLLNNWDVSSVTNMGNMFTNADNFNQPLNSWDVSSVTSMEEMFYMSISFNQDISSWNVQNVTNMLNMFKLASSFTTQDLSSWNVSNVTNHTDFMTNSGSGNTEPTW